MFCDWVFVCAWVHLTVKCGVRLYLLCQCRFYFNKLAVSRRCHCTSFIFFRVPSIFLLLFCFTTTAAAYHFYSLHISFDRAQSRTQTFFFVYEFNTIVHFNENKCDRHQRPNRVGFILVLVFFFLECTRNRLESVWETSAALIRGVGANINVTIIIVYLFRSEH